MRKSSFRIALLYTGGRHMAGIERYLQTLLTNTIDFDYELELISLGNWDLTKLMQDDARKVIVFRKQRLSLRTLYALGKYLKNNQFDLLVSHGSLSNFYARLISAWFKIPNLATIHSKLEYDYKGLAKHIHKIVDRTFRRFTKHYLAVSDFIRCDLISSGIKPDKISRVYNGVVAYQNGSIVKTHPNNFTVGSVGRLESVKNYSALIKAMDLVKNKDIKLVIAGDGPDRNSLNQLIEELNLKDRVKLVGYQKELSRLLSGFDIYVQPSLAEGFGLAVVEAMLAKKPVLVSPVGSLPELVVDGQSGFVLEDVEPVTIAQKLDDLSQVSNQKYLEAIANQGYNLAKEKFNVNKFIGETLKVYNEVIKS